VDGLVEELVTDQHHQGEEPQLEVAVGGRAEERVEQGRAGWVEEEKEVDRVIRVSDGGDVQLTVVGCCYLTS